MTDLSEDEWVRSMKEVIASSIESNGTRCGACDSKYECACEALELSEKVQDAVNDALGAFRIYDIPRGARPETCIVCFNQECSCKPAAAMEYQLTRTSCL